MNSRHKLMRWAVAGMILCLIAVVTASGVPADGSYEGDGLPADAIPAWQGGMPGEKGISLLEWSVIRDGVLALRPGTPRGASMFIAPAPLAATTYTIEVRFRIMRCATEGRNRYPLVFVFGKREAGYHWINAGWDNEALVESSLSLNKTAEFRARAVEPGVITGQWMILRCLVADTPAGLSAKAYLNGKLFQEVFTPVRSANMDWFHVRAADDGAEWEIDYLRWKNALVTIEQPLDRPLTAEEKRTEEEAFYKQQLEWLVSE